MDKIFYDCKNLQCINVRNVITSSSAVIPDMLIGMPQNFFLCYPNSLASKIVSEVKSNICRVKDFSENWKAVQKKNI